MHRQILRCDEVTVDNSLSAGTSLTTKRIAPLQTQKNQVLTSNRGLKRRWIGSTVRDCSVHVKFTVVVHCDAII